MITAVHYYRVIADVPLGEYENTFTLNLTASQFDACATLSVR